MSGFKAKLRRAVNEEGFKWTGTLEAISEEIELLACDIRALRSSDSCPAAPQLAAPPPGWLTDRERRAVAYFAQVCRDDLVPDEWTDNAGVLLSILARAGSPPVERPILRIAHLPSMDLLGTGIEYDLGRRRARDMIVQSLLDAGYRVEIPGYGIREPEASAPFPVVRYLEKSPE